jgi:hypothetical protein
VRDEIFVLFQFSVVFLRQEKPSFEGLGKMISSRAALAARRSINKFKRRPLAAQREKR